MADIKKIISDLKQSFGGSNEDQMKAVELLKGLALSDDPKANEFMKALDKATTDIASEKKEHFHIIEITEDIHLPRTNIILEKGDRIQVLKEEFIELMFDSRRTSVVELFNRIKAAFQTWIKDTRRNYTDEDAEEWGYDSISEVIQAGRDELFALFDTIER